MRFTVRRSRIDPEFLEVLEKDRVVREVKVPFQLRKIPPSFASLEEIEQWLVKIEKALARTCAYACLARKSYSSRDLLKKLRGRRFSDECCGEVLEELVRLGYLCDEEFFERAIEREFQRGKGPYSIARKLGIEEEKVRALISREKQRAQLQKLKKKGLSNQALMRRGFDLEQILES